MKKTYSYGDCYQILGLQPDCSWKELRASYKKLIQKWHPDRYSDQGPDKSAADEKIKSINIAYNQLSSFYRKNQSLPPIETRQPEPAKARVRPQSPAPEAPPVRKPRTPPKTEGRTTRQPIKPAKRSRYATFIAVASLIAFIYLFYAGIDTEEEQSIQGNRTKHPIKIKTTHLSSSEIDKDDLEFSASQHSKHPDKDKQEKKKHKAREKYFSYGANISEVIGIQGVPDKTDGDIWYYGESEVHFDNGIVTYWIRKPGSPLKARLRIGTPDTLNSQKSRPLTH